MNVRDERNPAADSPGRGIAPHLAHGLHCRIVWGGEAIAELSKKYWLRISGGIAALDMHQTAEPFPVGSLQVGALDTRDGFTSGVEYAGAENLLGHLRYENGYTLRALAFKRNEPHALASGVFESQQGLVAQFFSDNWFAQYFSTDSRFGMLRFPGSYLTGVAVYEQRNQLAGFSVRNSEAGFHLLGLRCGLSLTLVLRRKFVKCHLLQINLEPSQLKFHYWKGNRVSSWGKVREYFLSQMKIMC